MSLAKITDEMKRFLNDDTPSVLCVKGKWGVGKTFIWNKILLDNYDKLRLDDIKYSYVSLFGINSLNDLRSAITENTVSADKLLTGVNLDTFHIVLRQSSRPILNAIASIFRRDNLYELYAKSSFIFIRDQLICIDDLERAGSGLDQKDVLGIASFLKEKRGCKVVILYNEQELNENKPEFDKQIEKVADKIIEFSLSSQEAANVAITGNDLVCNLVKARISDINLTNIRIIKRIDNYIREFDMIFKSLDDPVIEQIVSALVLGSWSFHQSGNAAPLHFIRNYDRFSFSLEKEETSSENKKWTKMLDEYPYNRTDELDNAIFNCIETGIFDLARIKELSDIRQEIIRVSGKKNSFNMTWEHLFHGSLSIDDNEFLDALYNSAVDNIKSINQRDVNSAVEMLRKFGQSERADGLAVNYVDCNKFRGIEFFDIESNNFMNGGKLDPKMESEFRKYIDNYVDDRPPLDVFQSMAERQSWDEQDLLLISKQSSDSFEEMFLATRGPNLRRAIELVLMISRQRRPEADAIRLAAGEALRRIAASSPIRALRLHRYGIDPVNGIATDQANERGA